MRAKNMLIVSLAAILALWLSGCANKVTGNAVINDIGSSDDYIKIPLSELSADIKFYEYDDNSITIRYLAVLGSDGKPRTAFDACDVCKGYKGYRQVGNDIKCNKCGKTFSIDGLGTKNKAYGCWPSYLPNKVDGNSLLIKISDLKVGRNKFI